MKKRGEIFLRKLQEARPKIARLGAPFILDGHKILTHSKSRVVLQMLVEAARTKRFHVFITESHPDLSGMLMKEELAKHDISCTVILDAAMGYVMESVDLVLVGAEGVVESGGIINKVTFYKLCHHFALKIIRRLFSWTFRLEHSPWLLWQKKWTSRSMSSPKASSLCGCILSMSEISQKNWRYSQWLTTVPNSYKQFIFLYAVFTKHFKGQCWPDGSTPTGKPLLNFNLYNFWITLYPSKTGGLHSAWISHAPFYGPGNFDSFGSQRRTH